MTVTYSNQTKNTLVIVILGVFVIGSFIGWKIFIGPPIRQLEFMDNENRNTLKKGAAIAALSGLKKGLDKYSPALFETNDFTWLIDELNRTALHAGLILVLATPLGEEERGNYTKLTLRIEARGGYHELGRFVSLVENSSRFIKISNLHVVSPDLTNDTEPGLKISMSLSIFSTLKKAAANDTP